MGVSIVSAMGVCLGSQIKAEGLINFGLSSKSVNGDTENVGIPCCKVSDELISSRNAGEILQSSNLKSFTLTELQAATRNFRVDIVLGDGDFGSVFKGRIDEHSPSAAKPGTCVSVKKLNQDGVKSHNELMAEVNYLGQLSHPHLVKWLLS